MPFTLLATADLHLGRSSSSLKKHDDLLSTRHTWQLIIEYAIDHQIDAITLSGDIIDQDNRYFEAIGSIQEAFAKLKGTGIHVYMVAGNHDYDVLRQIIHDDTHEYIHLLGRDGEWETLAHPESNVQFTGWSFTHHHYKEDPLQKFDSAPMDKNKFTIGLLHGDIDSPESAYARIPSNSLKQLPVSAWLLGHIHKPGSVALSTPFISYTGSPHALSPAEKGAHGPVKITIDEDVITEVRQIPLSPVRYENLIIEIGEEADEETVRTSIVEAIEQNTNTMADELDHVHYLLFDLLITGYHSHPVHVEEWIQRLPEDFSTQILQTKVSVRKAETTIQPVVSDLEKLSKEVSPAGMLAQTILAIQQNQHTSFLEEITSQWTIQSRKIENATTFLPLKELPEREKEASPAPRDYILQECKRLLGTLIAQQNNKE